MESIIIKNYKCFDNEGTKLNGFRDINVIIGKNNSGKSSIIDIIKFLVSKDPKFYQSNRSNITPSLVFEYKIIDEIISQVFNVRSAGGELRAFANHYEFGRRFVGRLIEFEEINVNQRQLLAVDGMPDVVGKQYFEKYLTKIISNYEGKSFAHLTAERDIQPERPNVVIMNVGSNGEGATNLIQNVINKNDLDSALIEVKLLEELNRITKPDIEFSRILVQLRNDETWEVYFENNTDGRVALSKMGSGIKTILLVLLLIEIKPTIDKKPISSYVFALEELENNLHPSQQRRLYHYLYQFAEKNKCKFFFTTHSNIVIDLYHKLDNTQIIHISRNQGKTEAIAIDQSSKINQVLDDLDIKASDILQSNSIIWVEGPSDRTYLNRWISLIDPTLLEGYHYTIMFYGGRLLSNVTLDYEAIGDELIPLIKLNRNCMVMMDSDGKSDNEKLNQTKNRIASELREDRVWVTQGREIENYLSNNTLNNWLLNEHDIDTNLVTKRHQKLESLLQGDTKANAIKYSQNKNKFASEIVNYIEEDDLNIHDLRPNIEKVVHLIKQWNKQ